MRTSASIACAAETQWIVDFTLRPSGALPPRVAGSYVQCTSTTPPLSFFTTVFAEIVLLDVENLGKWHLALPGAFVLGIVDRLDFVNLTFRVVIDHDLQWPQDGHHAWRALIQLFADEVFEHRKFQRAIGLRNPDGC